jgi:tetratricopeptide (TPR) repeat protein
MNWRHEAALRYAETAIEVARTDEERHWFELFRALSTSRMGQHDKAIGMYDRIAEQSHDPGMRASALLAKSQYEPPREAWSLCEAVLDLSSIDSLVWWDEGVAAWLIGEGALDVGRYDLALKMEERCLDLSRRGGWNVMHGHGGALVAWLYSLTGRLDEAAALIADTIPVARRILGPNITILSVLCGAADIARLRGDLDGARSHVEEARWSSKRDDILARSIKATTHQSALIARDDGAYEDALQMLDDLPLTLAGLGSDHDTELPPNLWTARASIEVRSENPAQALENLKRALDQPRDLAHLDALEAVETAAIALTQQEKAAQAATLFGAVEQERDDCGLVVPPPDRPVLETAMSHAQAALGYEWDAAANHGRSKTLEEATALAVAATDSGEQSHVEPRKPVDKSASKT